MAQYFIDFTIIAAIVVGITALNGVISNVIGIKLFGRGQENLHTDHTAKTQAGWKLVGGKK